MAKTSDALDGLSTNKWQGTSQDPFFEIVLDSLGSISSNPAGRHLGHHESLHLNQGNSPKFPQGLLDVADDIESRTEGSILALFSTAEQPAARRGEVPDRRGSLVVVKGLTAMRDCESGPDIKDVIKSSWASCRPQRLSVF